MPSVLTFTCFFLFIEFASMRIAYTFNAWIFDINQHRHAHAFLSTIHAILNVVVGLRSCE